MGILSLFWGSKKDTNSIATAPKPDLKSESPPSTAEVSPGMNGAMEVPRPDPVPGITIFEFGSIAATGDKVTLTGYCPVSEELAPCRWEILPATDPEAPQFRVVF